MIALTLVATKTDPKQFTVDLHFGDYAIITLVNDGWSLAVHPLGQSPVDRGLFGTPLDARALLEAEVTHRMTDWAERNLRPPHRASSARGVVAAGRPPHS